MSPSYSPVIMLVATASIALALLFRKPILLFVARVFRSSVRRITGGMRSLGIARKSPSSTVASISVASTVGLSIGPIARAFATQTETDIAIGSNFDATSIEIDRKKQLFCEWLSPGAPQYAKYDRARAAVDFESAKRFFNTDVPLSANPLNLYDDIEGAFIVELFKESDSEIFYVLSEFRKAISSNVLKLSILFSMIITYVAIANLIWSTSVNFYGAITIFGDLPTSISFAGLTFDVKETINKFFFGFLSCFLGYALMWLFQHTEYVQFQRSNGQHLKTYLVGYLGIINSNFNQIHASAAQTISEDDDVKTMKKDTIIWITNLQWMAYRAFFIECYLRNLLFQLRRNGGYALTVVPLCFILTVVLVAGAFGLPQLNLFDTAAPAYHQNSFYIFFPLLLVTFYKYLRGSIAVVWESIETREWSKFNQLKVQDAMTEIMDSYVTQLDRWRSVMKART